MASKSPAKIAGLYAITPDLNDTKLLCIKVEACLRGGVRLIQYRNKAASPSLRAQQAQALKLLCDAYTATLIINDDIKLCMALDADGLHLGSDDGDLQAARQRLGGKILGASCYNQYENALQAQAAGADYIAYGSCFLSATKPNAPRADANLFAQTLQIPKVAIGGINLENAPSLIAAGADAIAVIGQLFDCEDIAARSRDFCALFNTPDQDIPIPPKVSK